MKRRFFNFAAAMSLLVCIGMVALWVGSYWRIRIVHVFWDEWPAENQWRSRGIGLRMVKGYWIGSRVANDFDLNRPGDIVEGWDDRDAQRFREEHPGGLRWARYSAKVLPRGEPLLGIQPTLGFGYRRLLGGTPARADDSAFVLVPAWTTTAALLVLPLWWSAAAFRRHRRKIRGLCPTCGYDLRATPDRCPECGAEPAVK